MDELRKAFDKWVFLNSNHKPGLVYTARHDVTVSEPNVEGFSYVLTVVCLAQIITEQDGR